MLKYVNWRRLKGEKGTILVQNNMVLNFLILLSFARCKLNSIATIQKFPSEV